MLKDKAVIFFKALLLWDILDQRANRVLWHYKVNVNDRILLEAKDNSPNRGETVSCNFFFFLSVVCLCLRELLWAATVIKVCLADEVKAQTEIRAELCGLLWPSLIAGNFHTGPVERNVTHSCYWTSSSQKLSKSFYSYPTLNKVQTNICGFNYITLQTTI